MKLSEVSETQNARDDRVEQLWRKLDTKNKGEINLQELQKGLRRIDHPLKDASDMLRDVVKAMDKNGDEVIQYDGMDETYSHFTFKQYSLGLQLQGFLLTVFLIRISNFRRENGKRAIHPLPRH